MSWYYADAGRQVGPVEDALQLRNDAVLVVARIADQSTPCKARQVVRVWDALSGEHFAKLLRDRRLRSPMRKRVGRKKNFADAFAAAAFGDRLPKHPRRKPWLHELAIRDDAC